MRNIRVGAFETNSSNYHSFTIHVGDYMDIVCYDEYERDDIYLQYDDLYEILDHTPLNMLEDAAERKKYKELENQANTQRNS